MGHKPAVRAYGYGLGLYVHKKAIIFNIDVLVDGTLITSCQSLSYAGPTLVLFFVIFCSVRYAKLLQHVTTNMRAVADHHLSGP